MKNFACVMALSVLVIAGCSARSQAVTAPSATGTPGSWLGMIKAGSTPVSAATSVAAPAAATTALPAAHLTYFQSCRGASRQMIAAYRGIASHLDRAKGVPSLFHDSAWLGEMKVYANELRVASASALDATRTAPPELTQLEAAYIQMGRDAEAMSVSWGAFIDTGSQSSYAEAVRTMALFNADSSRWMSEVAKEKALYSDAAVPNLW